MPKIGIYDYRHRAYAPELGRFLQPDPTRFAAGDANLYRYCGNDPVDLIDPLGLYIMYGAGGDKRFWDGYRRAYARMNASSNGQKLLSYLETSPLPVDVSPESLPNDIGKAKPVYRNGKVVAVEVTLDPAELTSGLWDSVVPHELYHATDYLTGRTGRTFLSPDHDPLNMGYARAATDYPGVDAMENRASRFAGQKRNLRNRQPGHLVPP